jgi:spore coat polysaccharide biosynthesis protein SpsF
MPASDGSRTVAVIQARMTSTRLPGKVLRSLFGAPLLVRVVERVRRIEAVDEIVIAVPDGEAHEPIVALAKQHGFRTARGPEDDVLHRTRSAAEDARAQIVMRITSDCPFIDPGVSTAVLAAFRAAKVSYAATAMSSGFPIGLDTELMTIDALRAADQEARDPYEREHATPFIWRQPRRFSAIYLDHRPDLRSWRLAVDAPEDLLLAEAVYAALYPAKPAFELADICQLFARQPQLLELNRGIQQTPYRGASSA